MTYRRGVNTLSVNLIKHLAQDSDIDEIFVICDGVDEDAYKSLKHKKVNMQTTGWVKRSDFLRVFIRNIRYLRLSSELKEFDVFHVLDNRALPFVHSSVHPLVVTIHNAMTQELFSVLNAIELVGINGLPGTLDLHMPQVFLECLTAKKANKIIVNDLIIARRLKKLYGNVITRKIRIVPPGFDEKRFHPCLMSKSEAKKLLKLDCSSRVLLHVGGSSERKGLPYLLHALSYLYRTGQLERLNIVLLVLGKIERKWSQLISRIRKHVLELPYVPEEFLPNVYRAADLFVMPSVVEGWGIALIESLACGTPAIASTHVPSAFALKNSGVVQIEPEVNDPAKFGKSILNTFESDFLGFKDWNRIFDSLVLHFSWNNYARHLVDVYRECAREKL